MAIEILELEMYMLSSWWFNCNECKPENKAVSGLTGTNMSKLNVIGRRHYYLAQRVTNPLSDNSIYQLIKNENNYIKFCKVLRDLTAIYLYLFLWYQAQTKRYKSTSVSY